MGRHLLWGVLSASSTLLAAHPLDAQVPAPQPAKAHAVAEVEAAEAARIRGDSAAWMLVAPEFLFVHSTGGVDSLAAYRADRARRVAAAPAGAQAPPRTDAEPPHDILIGDILVRVRLQADPVPAGVSPRQSRLLDIYVRRNGQWHWLAHQTSEVRPRWAPVAPESTMVDEYVGTYAAGDGTQRTYAWQAGVFVQTTSGGGVRPLVPLSEATFGYQGLSATVTFVRDRSGRVIAAEESSRVAFTRFVRVYP